MAKKTYTATNTETDVTESTKVNNVIDLDLSVTNKKRFRFNNDDSRTVELNLSDMGIVTRLSESYPKLKEYLVEVSGVADGLNVDDSDDDSIIGDMSVMGKRLQDIDAKMRELIDYIFNASVSAVAAPDGSMYDLFEGQFRFEYIIDLLIQHYTNNVDSEFKKLQSHVDKYTKG